VPISPQEIVGQGIMSQVGGWVPISAQGRVGRGIMSQASSYSSSHWSMPALPLPGGTRPPGAWSSPGGASQPCSARRPPKYAPLPSFPLSFFTSAGGLGRCQRRRAGSV
jgi:hypothetical protein